MAEQKSKSKKETIPIGKARQSQQRPITNKHYKEKPILEKLHAVVDYLASDCLECLGGKILPM